jgi:hypothetical protein
LKTIDYNLKISHLEIQTTRDGNVDVTGTIVLTNHGRTTLSFGIKLPENNLPERFLIHKEVDLMGIDGPVRSSTFRLSPGETKAINISSVQSQSEDYIGKGQTNGPDLILYTELEHRVVGYNR